MVHYQFKVYVPSWKRKVSFREITLREYININKSIINNDRDEIVECFDRVVSECCAEKENEIPLTLFDKVIVLLTIRAYSVSTFCTLLIKDHEEGKEFDHVLELNALIKRLLELPINHSKSYDPGELSIEYGIPLHPIQDVNSIKVSDYIHYIKTPTSLITKRGDIEAAAEHLEVEFFDLVKRYATEVYEIFQSNPVYVIPSPFPPTRNLITQKMGLDYTMYDLLKMLYTENPHNLYRSIYNFNQALNMSPLYTENLVPVEKDLLWSYHIKDQRDAELSKGSNVKTGTFTP